MCCRASSSGSVVFSDAILCLVGRGVNRRQLSGAQECARPSWLLLRRSLLKDGLSSEGVQHCTVSRSLTLCSINADAWLQNPPSLRDWECIGWSAPFCSAPRSQLTSAPRATAFLFGAGDVLAQQAVENKGREHDVRSSLSAGKGKSELTCFTRR